MTGNPTKFVWHRNCYYDSVYYSNSDNSYCSMVNCKNYQPQTVLLLAGLALLTITVLFYPENSILYDKAKSTGSTLAGHL